MKNILAALCVICLLGSATNTNGQDKPVVPAAENTLTMISLGAEPRQELRYKFSQEVQRVDLGVKMGTELKMGISLLKQEIPAVAQTLEIVPISVKDGVMNFQSTLSEITTEGGQTADPTMVAAMQELSHGIVGNTGTGKVSQRGVVSGGVNGSKNTSHVTSPLPLEAVGVGAQWKVDAPALLNGVVANTAYTYKILSIEDDLVKVAVDIEMAAGKQVMDNTNSPAGTTIIVNSIKGSGKGISTYDLKSMCPLATVEMNLVQDGAIIIAGQPDQEISVTADFTLMVKSPRMAKSEVASQVEK